jgi:hypothetical protein
MGLWGEVVMIVINIPLLDEFIVYVCLYYANRFNLISIKFIT